MPRTRVTRRAAATGLLLPLASPAQPAPPEAAPPQDDLTIQRNNVKRNSDALAKVKLGTDLEPAFSFKA